MIDTEQLKQQAITLKLHGLLAHWHEVTQEQYPWLETLLSWEYKERKQRSLERRLNNAKLGHFKPLNEFDWQWPDQIDPQAIQTLMQLDFLTTASNIILLGSNGVGKRLHRTWGIRPLCKAIPCCLPLRQTCLMIWQQKMVISRCGVD